VVGLPAQGDVWWAEAEDKRRPVLVCTRNEAIAVLQSIVVAPVTRTVRGIPTELVLGGEEGLDVEYAATLDNLQTIPRRALTTRLGALHPIRHRELCVALRAMSDGRAPTSLAGSPSGSGLTRDYAPVRAWPAPGRLSWPGAPII
jgi:mRNA interferase MazF